MQDYRIVAKLSTHSKHFEITKRSSRLMQHQELCIFRLGSDYRSPGLQRLLSVPCLAYVREDSESAYGLRSKYANANNRW